MMNHDHGLALYDVEYELQQLAEYEAWLATFWRRVPAPLTTWRNMHPAHRVRATDLAGRT